MKNIFFLLQKYETTTTSFPTIRAHRCDGDPLRREFEGSMRHITYTSLRTEEILRENARRFFLQQQYTRTLHQHCDNLASPSTARHVSVTHRTSQKPVLRYILTEKIENEQHATGKHMFTVIYVVNSPSMGKKDSLLTFHNGYL